MLESLTIAKAMFAFSALIFTIFSTKSLDHLKI